MKWITRERPKIDRIACPWLVARFVDEAPEFLYEPGDEVMRVAHCMPLAGSAPGRLRWDQDCLRRGPLAQLSAAPCQSCG
jgi:hypothetical protein